MRTTEVKRNGGREAGEMRALAITPGVSLFAEGSALIKLGQTQVLCTATVEDRVPPWKKGKGSGWVTAEYSMLPRATKERTRREADKGRQGGRTLEIQRLISRSLRSVTDLAALGERQIIVDCDVLQADGGTRCAAISGGFVAMSIAINQMMKTGVLRRNPIRDAVAAISAGIVGGAMMLDLEYAEDAGADVDSNIVMTGFGRFVEVQSTAEGATFTLEELQAMLALASSGLELIFEIQREAINGA